MHPSPAPADHEGSRATPRLGPGTAGLGFLAFVAVAGLFQLLTPVPWDADTAYHVAVAALVREHGILRAFPWTPFSWLADHYADKELLFHLLLAPLTGLGWIWAAKVAGALLGGALLFSLWLVLRAEGVPRAAVWALVPLAASGAFVLRFAIVRPHLVSIALALLVAWAAARGRAALVAAASFLYPWCYVAFETPLVLVAIAEAARVLSGRRAGWRPIAAALLGAAAGVALHPNAANLLSLWRLVHVDVLLRGAWGGASGFELGRELGPFAPGDAIRYALLPAAMAVAAVVFAWRERARDALPLSFALSAAAYGAMTVGSSRFVEYLAPFAAAALALALRGRSVRLATGTLAGAFAFTAAFGAAPVLALGTRGDEIPPAFQQFLRARIPGGEQVFTCDWGLTGELMIALPGRRFVVALDPTLFHARDPDLYRVWYALPREGPPDAKSVIRERFGARWVVCFSRPEYAPLVRRLTADPGVRTVFANPLWVVLDLGPGNGAPF
jgi:hypothetical protein